MSASNRAKRSWAMAAIPLGIFIVLIAPGCGRDALSYLTLGDRHFGAGKYNDASLNYRKAIQKNPKLGDAYYGLGRSELKLQNADAAYQALQEAVILLPERTDVKVALADLTLAGYEGSPPGSPQSGALYKSLASLTDEIARKDPNSFDALRMKGNVSLLDAKSKEAIEYFRRANDIKPFEGPIIIGYVRALFDAEKDKEAEGLARQMIEKRKDFSPIYNLLYSNYIREGRQADAEAILKEKIRNFPGDPIVVLELAAHYSRAKNPAAAHALLDDLLKKAPAGSDIWTLVGDFSARAEDWDQAAIAYEKGVVARPDKAAEFQKRISLVRSAQGRTDEALAVLSSVLAKNPKDQEAALVRADLLLTRGRREDLDSVIATYTSAKNQQGNIRRQTNLGKAYLAKNELEAARKTLLTVVLRDPNADDAKLSLAETEMMQGKFGEALEHLNQLLAKTPADGRVRLLKMDALISVARYDDARIELDKLVRDFPAAKNLRIQQGLLAILSKRYKDAESIFSSLSLKSGGDWRVAAGLAETYVSRQQFDKAIKLLESEVSKDPRSVVMRQMLSRTLIQGGRPKDGIAQLDKLKVERPTSVQILVDLGDGWLKEGDNAKAAEQYRAALRLAPNNSRLHMLLGFTLESANESQGAIAEYRQALALEPGNSLAMNNLAYVLAEHGGQTEEALGLAQKALQISPKEPDLLETLGWIYLKKGLPNSAVKVYSDLCREWPDRPLYQHHLGLALLAEGDSAAGRKALQAALENHPDASEAAQIRHDLDRIGPR